MNCDVNGHLFLHTDPPTCSDCGIELSKYDLIQTKGTGRVFILGRLNELEQLRFDRALRRRQMNRLSLIMRQAFRRLGIDITKEYSQLHRPF